MSLYMLGVRENSWVMYICHEDGIQGKVLLKDEDVHGECIEIHPESMCECYGITFQ